MAMKFARSHAAKCVAAALLLQSSLAAHSTERARIAVVGDLDVISIGQDGFCGERTLVDRKAWHGIFVTGGQRTWFRTKSTKYMPSYRVECAADYSFLPEAENAYILRFSFVGNECLSELFRVVRGGDPVREPLAREEPQVCLTK